MINSLRYVSTLASLVFIATTGATADCTICGFAPNAQMAFLQPPQPPLGGSIERENPQAPSDRVPGNPARSQGKLPADAEMESDRCLSIAEVADKDGDFERNRAHLEAPEICMTKKVFKEGSLTWTLQIIQNKTDPGGYFWFVPHDNENVAFDTAAYGVRKFGGAVVAIETGGSRNNQGQDPNRNFDAGSAAPQKCRDQIARSPLFTANVLKFYNDSTTVMALHSNTPGGGISMKTPLGGNRHFPARVPFPSQSADDTMIFVASTEPPEGDRNLRSFVSRLNERGINVIYETVSPAKNDCSFSNYAALTGIRDYINLEVVTGDGPAQKRMLELVIPLLEDGIDAQTPQAGLQTPTQPPAPGAKRARPQVTADPRAKQLPAPAPSASNTPVDGPLTTQDGSPPQPPAAIPQQRGSGQRPEQQTATAEPIAIAPTAQTPVPGPDRTPVQQQAAAAPLGTGNPAPAPAAQPPAQGKFIARIDFVHAEQDARNMKRNLQTKLGLGDEDIFVRPSTQNGKSRFDILLGPFGSLNEARTRCKELQLPEKKCYIQNNY